MPKQFDGLHARVTQDASEVKKQGASTSFDPIRFLAERKGKSEETQAATTAYEGYYTKNEILAQRALQRANFDQEQWAKHPRDKVVLAHDYSKGGTLEQAQAFWDKLNRAEREEWDNINLYHDLRNQMPDALEGGAEQGYHDAGTSEMRGSYVHYEQGHHDARTSPQRDVDVVEVSSDEEQGHHDARTSPQRDVDVVEVSSDEEQVHHDARTSPQSYVKDVSKEKGRKMSILQNLDVTSISAKVSKGRHAKNNTIEENGHFYKNYKLITGFKHHHKNVTLDAAYKAFEEMIRAYRAKEYNETEAACCKKLGI